ncbi:MAG: hypothetical protein ACPF8V_11280 [Luteibaculum sp.]
MTNNISLLSGVSSSLFTALPLRSVSEGFGAIPSPVLKPIIPNKKAVPKMKRLLNDAVIYLTLVVD